MAITCWCWRTGHDAPYCSADGWREGGAREADSEEVKGCRIRHAQILQKLDRGPENEAWTYDRIHDASGATRATIVGIARRFVMDGLEAAPRRKPGRIADAGRREMWRRRTCAIACSSLPEGTSRWTPQMIADELARLEMADPTGATTVCDVLKNEIRPKLVGEWRVPVDAEFVAAMEYVLEVCERARGPLRPVVRIDGTSRQLVEETRIARTPGSPEKVYSVHERNGVPDVLMNPEPVAGGRDTVVKETRTAVDFTRVFHHVSGDLCPTEGIVPVTDNLSTRSPASLCRALPPEEARRLVKRSEWRHTSKHGSWLAMAEIELGAMCRQALAKSLPDEGSFRRRIRTWTGGRNAESTRVNWQFTTPDARTRLARLCPTIV